MDELQLLTSLAYEYGPFLFALIFNLIITRWGHRIYTAACSRKDPVASEREKDTYRLYFLAMASFGMFLVVASIAWWIVDKQPERYVFEGKIKNLKSYEQIASNELYFKPVFLSPVQRDAPLLRNEHFIIVRDTPFQEGESFDLVFSKGENSFEQFELPYHNSDDPSYKIEWDDEKGKTMLKDLTPKPLVNNFLISSAYAQEESPIRPFIFNQRTVPLQQPMAEAAPELLPENDLPDTIENLQRERTPIFRKLEILKQLLHRPANSLRDYQEPAMAEPLLLTLLDLTHATDKELAYFTRAVIHHHYGNFNQVDNLIKNLLLSEQTQQQQKGSTIIKRLKLKRALRILHKIDTQEKTPKIIELEQYIQAHGTRELIPTIDHLGDMYCVKTQWQDLPLSAQQCLRRLETDAIQETTPNTNDDKAWFFNRTKARALAVADEIEACGGTAEFIGWKEGD